MLSMVPEVEGMNLPARSFGLVRGYQELISVIKRASQCYKGTSEHLFWHSSISVPFWVQALIHGDCLLTKLIARSRLICEQGKPVGLHCSKKHCSNCFL
jgi:hypothetical protein